MALTRSRSQYHHGDLETALISTARKLVKKNGSEHLSLRQVASEIGVSPSATYHYFSDRDSLLAALGSSLFDELADFQEIELSKISGKSAKAARDRFRALGITYFTWASKEPHFFNLMFSELCNFDSSMKKEDTRAYTNLTKCLDDLLEVGLLETRIRPYAELLSWSVVHGATSLIIGGHLAPENYGDVLDGLELALGIRSN